MSSQPASQPDSIDLAYDMWAGQFEFVGPTTSANTTSTTANNRKSTLNNTLKFGDRSASHKLSNESLEDLNLNFNSSSVTNTNSMSNSAYSLGCGYDSDYGKQPILIDQETFLSLNPNDFDDIVPSSGPNSLIFIDNKLVDTECNNNKIVNYESLTNKCNNKTNNTNTNGFKLENLKNFKNKLICNYEEKATALSENNNNKMNGISLEMCENLNEQVSKLRVIRVKLELSL